MRLFVECGAARLEGREAGREQRLTSLIRTESDYREKIMLTSIVGKINLAKRSIGERKRRGGGGGAAAREGSNNPRPIAEADGRGSK